MERFVIGLREATLLVALGTGLGLGQGALRGIPGPPPAPDEGEVCAAPLGDEQPVTWIAQAQASAIQQDPNVIFVDARTRPDYEAGHIPGALSAPALLNEVHPELLKMLATASTVIAYGDQIKECKRSKVLAKMLSNAGLPDVRVLEGGFPTWLARGAPAQAGPCELCPEWTQNLLPPSHRPDGSDDE